MFNWNDIRIMLEVVRAGSISCAAAAVRVDPSTVSRRLQALERELGTPIFERTSGRLTLRAEHQTLLAEAGKMEAAAIEIERAAHLETSPAAGRVRVATTRTMARTIVMPAVDALARDHEHLTVEVDTQVQRIDLMRDEAEIALTCYDVNHPRLIKRLAFDATAAMYASQSYVDQRGLPVQGEFAKHRLLALAEVNAATTAGAWWMTNVRGGVIVLRSSSTEEQLDLCAEGRGLALLFCFRAEQRDLVRVRDLPTTTLPHWLVVHPDRQRVARVRTVMDAIASEIEKRRHELEGPRTTTDVVAPSTTRASIAKGSG